MRAILNAWGQLRHLPRSVWLLALVTLINRAGTMVVPFLILYLTRHLGFSTAVAGMLFASYGGAALLASPVAGKLCDRFGAHRVMAASLLTSSLAMLTYPLARSAPAVALATMALAFTNETFRPASLTIVGRLVPPEQIKQAFSLQRLAVNLGMSLGPALGGLLADLWFPLIFLADGATSLVGAVILLWQLRHLAGRVPDGGESVAARGGWDRRLAWFCLTTFPVFLVFFQLDAGLPLYMVHDLHLSQADFGLVFTVNTMLILLFEVPLNALTARWPHNVALFLGSLFLGAGFGGLIWAHNFAAVCVTVVVWTVGEMILFPTNVAFLAAISPPGREGVYMGVFSAVGGLAFLVGPAMGSQVLQHFGAETLWRLTLVLAWSAALMQLALVWFEPGPAEARAERAGLS